MAEQVVAAGPASLHCFTTDSCSIRAFASFSLLIEWLPWLQSHLSIDRRAPTRSPAIWPPLPFVLLLSLPLLQVTRVPSSAPSKLY